MHHSETCFSTQPCFCDLVRADNGIVFQGINKPQFTYSSDADS